MWSEAGEIQVIHEINIFSVVRDIGYFTFLYPVTMSVIWVVGGLYFWWRRERGYDKIVEDEFLPPVTILVPCHNEAVSIEATCQALSALDYPDYRVVFIDDASTDCTAEIVRRWVCKLPNFHLLRLKKNQGKAKALNCGLATAVNTPITVVIDADTLVVPNTIKKLTKPFTRQPSLGAISGNPLVYNRKNLLENIQTAEFASILSLIKRSQRSWGRILTVSGCLTAFRTDVLLKVGGFSTRSATEDIDITWAIQRIFYEVWFEPQAIAFILVPSKFKEYWKQRCRWALGGWHLLRKHKDVFTSLRWCRLWLTYIDFALSYCWSFCFVFGIITWVTSYLIFRRPVGLTPVPAWYGSVISFTCLVQFAAALLANRQYDSKLWKSFLSIPWYPLFFFCVGALTVVWTAAKGVTKGLESAGQWKSPTRESQAQSL